MNPTTPNTPFLRRRDVREWLEQYSPRLFNDFEKLVEAKAIERIQLHPNSRGYYRTDEIDEKILKPFRANPGPAATGAQH